MRGIVLVFALFVLAGCAIPVTAPPSASFEKILAVPGKTREQIFEESKQWMAKTFRSSKAVIEYENKDAGKIIGNGSVERALTQDYFLRMGHLVTFTLQQDIKDEKTRLFFTNFLLQVPRSQYETGGQYPLRETDIQPLYAKLDELSLSLSSYLNSKEIHDNW
jgi:hypothetical protein